MVPYVPSPEREEINYSKENSFTGFLRLLASAAALIALIISVFAYSGEFILLRVSPSVERFVFGRFSGLTYEHKPFPEGAALLKKLIGEEAEQYRVILLCEAEPNAIAFPGHTIGVTIGALKGIKSEQGLAFLLGHELGHFTHRDHLRGLGAGLGINFGLSLIGLDEFGAWISDLSSTVVARQFSQVQESAADEVAISLVHNLYGNLEGAAEFFEHALTKRKDSSLDAVFSSHPLTQSRINAIRARSAGLSEPQALQPFTFVDTCKEAEAA
jgi:Zn-dependent protease with chaperone function